jgi:hypothetical protein
MYVKKKRQVIGVRTMLCSIHKMFLCLFERRETRDRSIVHDSMMCSTSQVVVLPSRVCRQKGEKNFSLLLQLLTPELNIDDVLFAFNRPFFS